MYRHYPIVHWTIKNSFWCKIAQNFNTSNYGNWWIPINIILKNNVPENFEVWLTPRDPYTEINYVTNHNWIIIDIRQAGNYLSRNLIIYLRDYSPNNKYLFVIFYSLLINIQYITSY